MEQSSPSSADGQARERQYPLGQFASFILVIFGVVHNSLDGGEPFRAWPVALYGIDLLFAAIAYFILTKVIIAHHGRDSTLALAVGSDFKGLLSIILYLIAILLSLINSLYSCAVFVIVAIMWLIPDRRIEKVLT